MTKRIDLVLWMRLGDQGDYEEFGQDIDAAISTLNDAKVGMVISRASSGIMTRKYHGDNYISLFWGDKTGEDMIKVLSDAEFQYVKDGLKEF